MMVDLGRLKEAHPALPVLTAADLAQKAAHALQRRHHAPGVTAEVQAGSSSYQATLSWSLRPMTDVSQLDQKRITEDGAEAVALGLVHATHRWTVVRRLQQEEHADWLLREAKTRALVALEVSGTDAGDRHARLREKKGQVARSRAARQRAVCVVSFLEPHAAIELVSEAPR